MARIFISYATGDAAIAKRVQEWLQSQKYDLTFLAHDPATGIPVAADWERTLYRELGRSQALILILTEAWQASKWCFAEWAQARSLGKPQFALQYGPLKTPFEGKDRQVLDLRQDEERGLAHLAEHLRSAVSDSPEGFLLPFGVSPFPGLSTFHKSQAAVFYGREAETHRVLERLNACQAKGGEKLFLLVGESGCGKSSLLKAGVLPRLEQAPLSMPQWVVCPEFRPDGDFRDRLIYSLLRRLTCDSVQVKLWQEALKGQAAPQALQEIAEAFRDQSPNACEMMVVLPIDQAEEIFTNDQKDDTAGLALLSLLLGERLPFVVVATMRADYLPSLHKAEALSVPFSVVQVPQMPPERLAEVVRGPARQVGLTVDDGLIDALTADAQTADALPLVAATLEQLYRTCKEQGRLTRSAYESLGSRQHGETPLGSIVRSQADGALGTDALSEQDTKALQDAFVPHLVRVSLENDDFIRMSAPLDRLPERAHPFLERLITARLLVRRLEDSGPASQSDAKAQVLVEVAHESLFRVWDRLSAWLEDEREFLSDWEHIKTASAEWQKADKPESRLLHGHWLERARYWQDIHPQRIAERDEADFIAKSDQEDCAQRNRQKRQRRWLIGAVSAFLILLTGAGINTGFYLEQQKEALRVEVEAQRANDALDVAIQTTEGLIIDLLLTYRNHGIPNDVLKAVVEKVMALQGRLAEGGVGLDGEIG